MKDYKNINREAWNRRTEVNYESDFYDVKGFLEGKEVLNSIEMNLLGNLQEKDLLHLQCHFGQDTLALARHGAKVTGLDLSDTAIQKAQSLSRESGIDAKFIASDVYEAPKHIKEQFDVIFASYGVVGWLPDMSRWAKVISHFLRPGGIFVFAEFHPVVWMFDDDFQEVKYDYDNKEVIEENTEGVYSEKESSEVFETVSWNHSLSEVIGALMSEGLSLEKFEEFDYSPYDCFAKTEEFEKGKFRIKHLGNKIPMVYALRMKKEER